MAATAEGVVSLAEIRTELRIPSGETSFDGMLRFQIPDAVSWVEWQTHLPLVDRTELFYLGGAGSTPVLLPAPFIREVTRVRYWSPDGALRSDPDGTIAVSDLGRTQVQPPRSGRLDGGLAVWPPAAGWPSVLGGSALEFRVRRGFVLTAETRGVRSPVIAAVRQLHDGSTVIRNTLAMDALLSPWRYYGPDDAGIREPEEDVIDPGGGTPTPAAYTRRVGWSAVAHTAGSFDAAAALLAGASSTTTTVTVPARTEPGGYLVLGVETGAGFPTMIMTEGSQINQIGGFTGQDVVLDAVVDGETFYVLVSNAEQNSDLLMGENLEVS